MVMKLGLILEGFKFFYIIISIIYTLLMWEDF